ncbi:MAG: hypothetical protein F4015_02360, partial [Acidimicrobiia bacterium]|nr:hypothetical protein [Acidimicrobiia bacterium]
MKAATRILTAVAAVLIATAGLGLASTSPAGAVSAAEVCSDHHTFGQEPVPVAKTADGTEVLAQVNWEWNETIGCYLVLDSQAVNTLRAKAAYLTTPTPTSDDVSNRCFGHHQFGQQSVPVAKTADGTTVLAQVQWGWEDSIGCYLVLDDQAVDALRSAATTPDPSFISIAVGRAHSCGVRTDEAIMCWGDNSDGQLEAPDGQYTAVSVGDNHTCAVRTDKAIACWGSNRSGQTDAPEGQFTAVSSNRSYSCGLKADRSIACWGDNGSGQANSPVGQHTTISAGSFHACALRVDQTIACWGWNGNGEADPPLGRYTEVDAGGSHSCGLRTDMTIACWGRRALGLRDAPAGSLTAVCSGGRRSCG